MNAENRNLILVILLSLGILFGYNYFFDTPSATQAPASASQGIQGPGSVNADSNVSSHQATMSRDTRPQMSSDQKLQQSSETTVEGPKVEIKTPLLSGFISLKGCRLDDLKLMKYRETLSSSSPHITLFAPATSQNPYYAEFGWVSSSQTDVPGPETVWASDDKVLTPESPLTLSWTNGQGIRFERIISVDSEYLFTVVDRVDNPTTLTLQLYPYGLILRGGDVPVSGYYALYEGPIGVLGNSLKETSYETIRSDKTILYKSDGGWIGMTDKYWLSALIPDPKLPIDGYFREIGLGSDGLPLYQTDFVGAQVSIAPHSTHATTHHLFAGAKVVSLLDAYETTLGVPKLDLSVDFGWFYIITKPLFYLLGFINQWVGNFGISILVLTVLMKILFLPLANKSYKTMARMKRLQPEIKALQEKYSGDKVAQNREVMAYYKRYRINPMAGCLPMIIQIPVFFGLYKVLFISLEMRHAPFFGWIHDLSAPDPTTIFNLFGLIPWMPPSYLMIGAWPLIMGVTMVLQQKMSPQPADPIQSKMMMAMPIFFTYLLAQFPVGLVIYWAWSNVLNIGQQWLVTKYDTKRGNTPTPPKGNRKLKKS